MIVDITTTSVGRNTIKTTYESFFKHAKFSGKYEFYITIDPSYGVSEKETLEVIEYLETIKKYDCVYDVHITVFDSPVGLEGALTVLFSQRTHEYGINLEDDWQFFKDFNVDDYINDIEKSKSCMIAFSSTHLQSRDTFLENSGVEVVIVNNNKYLKLIPPNWASDYIPLAPNIHDNYLWTTAYMTGLAMDKNKERCPDERTKEYVRSRNLREKLNVLWTEDIIVEDIGRRWLADHNRTKKILPDKNTNGKVSWNSGIKEHKGYVRSEYMHDRAIKVIPGQTQTFMKRGGDGYGKLPLYADKASGCRFFDVDGNCYIDYVAGLGVMQLGYCHPAFNEAIMNHLNKGVYFSLPTWHEIEAAELLQRVIPNAEMSRFLKSGGDACSAAITLARYITNKKGILSCGYHGWHEQFQPMQPGACDDLKQYILEFDIEKDKVDEILKKHHNKLACVIVALPYKKEIQASILHRLRKLCNQYGLLFILDDVVTGFRLAVGGAQEYYKFDADIIILSKALSAGAELAAICGKKKYMKKFEKLYVSTTMGGELTSLQCMINAINIYTNTKLIPETHNNASALREFVNKISNKYLNEDILFGYASILYLELSNKTKEELLIELLAKNGVYMRSGCNFVTGAHKEEDIRETINIFEKTILECCKQ